MIESSGFGDATMARTAYLKEQRSNQVISSPLMLTVEGQERGETFRRQSFKVCAIYLQHSTTHYTRLHATLVQSCIRRRWLLVAHAIDRQRQRPKQRRWSACEPCNGRSSERSSISHNFHQLTKVLLVMVQLLQISDVGPFWGFKHQLSQLLQKIPLLRGWVIFKLGGCYGCCCSLKVCPWYLEQALRDYVLPKYCK